MLRVRCQAQATLDAKGRLALPAPLRRALADHGHDRLVVTFNQGALWGYTDTDFAERVEAPLRERDPFDPAVLDFTHAIIGPAQDCEIDAAGRIRIPPLLRQLARLDKDVVIGTMGDRIEIWDLEAWEARFQAAVASTQARPGMPPLPRRE